MNVSDMTQPALCRRGMKQPRFKRWKISEYDRSVLESTLSITENPDADIRRKIANDLGRTPRQIQVWFQNKRQRKEKREELVVEHHEEDAPFVTESSIPAQPDLPPSQSSVSSDTVSELEAHMYYTAIREMFINAQDVDHMNITMRLLLIIPKPCDLIRWIVQKHVSDLTNILMLHNLFNSRVEASSVAEASFLMRVFQAWGRMLHKGAIEEHHVSAERRTCM